MKNENMVEKNYKNQIYHSSNRINKKVSKGNDNNSFIIDIKEIKKDIIKEKYTSKRAQSFNMIRCKININKETNKKNEHGIIIIKKLNRSLSYKEKYSSTHSSKNNSIILNTTKKRALSTSKKNNIKNVTFSSIDKKKQTNKFNKTLLLQTKKDINHLKDNEIFRCNQKFSELSVIHNLFLVRKINVQKQQTSKENLYINPTHDKNTKKEQPIRVIEHSQSVNQGNTTKKEILLYNFNDLDKGTNSFLQSSLNSSSIPKISCDIIERKNKKINSILSKANINLM